MSNDTPQHNDIIFCNTPTGDVKDVNGNCSKNSSSSDVELFPFWKQFIGVAANSKNLQ